MSENDTVTCPACLWNGPVSECDVQENGNVLCYECRREVGLCDRCGVYATIADARAELCPECQKKESG